MSEESNARFADEVQSDLSAKFSELSAQLHGRGQTAIALRPAQVIASSCPSGRCPRGQAQSYPPHMPPILPLHSLSIRKAHR